MSRPRVLVREPIAEAGVELLRERFDVDVDANGDLAEKIGDYDAIVIRSATKLTAELIERADRLKVIGRAGVGVDNVDVEAATRRGIVVANAPESTVISAAEHTIGLLVALARNIPQAHAALKQGRWERSAWGGVELEGKTLGVLGFGRIGQQVARRALGLGMRVVAYDPFVAKERFRELGVERVESPDDVLAAAEFLTLHLPLTAETRGFLGREAIAKLRDGARVDQRRPRRARRRGGARRGAPLGQARRAPRSTSTPRSRTRARCSSSTTSSSTPHLAASTEEAQDRAGVIVAEQVAAALEGAARHERGQHPRRSAPRTSRCSARSSRSPRSSAGWRWSSPGGRAERITLSYYGALSGYDTRLLTVAALNGAFQGRTDQPVNYVNAPLIAAERGIEVARGAPPRLPRLHEPRPRRGPLERRPDRASRARRSATRTATGSSARSASSSRWSSRR